MVVAEGWSVCANFLKEVCSALLLSHVHLFATPWTVAHQVHGDSPGKNARVGYHAFHQGIFPTRSPTLQVDSLPSEPPGTPKNTGVGSLFLPRNLSDPGIEPGSPVLQVDPSPAELTGKPS